MSKTIFSGTSSGAKNTLRWLWLSFLLSSVSMGSCYAKNRVFLLAGQSNMQGQGLNSELTTPYGDVQKDVNLWKSGWVKLSPGYGNGDDYFGPELAFGKAIKNALPNDTIYLVKYASNGKALYDDFKPFTGIHYIKMAKTFNAALSDLDNAGIEYEVSGMLWMQGESDAYEGQAASYQANLVDFIAVMRNEFGTATMPFIIGRVLDHFGGKVAPKVGQQTSPTQANIVRTAQVSVAQNTPFFSWFDTDSYQVVDPKSNPGHYGTQGQISLGTDFAMATLAIIRPD
jgi:hypothetical protein